MGEHNKDEQNLEADRVDREKVDRNELGHMIGEERSPRLGRRLGMADHVLRDGSLGDFNAQFQEFGMNSRRAPERNMLSSTYSSLCRPLVYVEQSNGAGERSALVQRERST